MLVVEFFTRKHDPIQLIPVVSVSRKSPLSCRCAELSVQIPNLRLLHNLN